MALVWNNEIRRWVDDATGRAATVLAVMAARDALADDYAVAFRQLAVLFTSGAITFDQWRSRFQALVVEAVGHGYTFGRGGIELMTPDDWTKVAQQVKGQLEYADGFADDVTARITERVTAIQAEAEQVVDDVTDETTTQPVSAADAEAMAKAEMEPAVAARSELYAGATVESFEEAQTEAHSANKGVLILPVYPADHGTECRSACRCGWQIIGDEEAQVWRCTWITAGDSGVCESCRERGRLYANLIVPYDGSAPRIE